MTCGDLFQVPITRVESQTLKAAVLSLAHKGLTHFQQAASKYGYTDTTMTEERVLTQYVGDLSYANGAKSASVILRAYVKNEVVDPASKSALLTVESDPFRNGAGENGISLKPAGKTKKQDGAQTLVLEQYRGIAQFDGQSFLVIVSKVWLEQGPYTLPTQEVLVRVKPRENI